MTIIMEDSCYIRPLDMREKVTPAEKAESIEVFKKLRFVPASKGKGAQIKPHKN